MSVDHVFEDRIWTDVCSIQRWPDAIYRSRPGTYTVISTHSVLELLKLASRNGTYGGYMHPTAVVDDFGDLVGVPA